MAKNALCVKTQRSIPLRRLVANESFDGDLIWVWAPLFN